MKQKIKYVVLSLVAALMLFMGFGTTVQAESPKTLQPNSNHPVVTDHAKILDNETKGLLRQQDEYYKSTKQQPQIALVTIKSSEDLDLQDYVHEMEQTPYWHVGSSKYNNGVIIVFAQNKGDNNVYLATGNGTRKFLSDNDAENILRDHEQLLKSNSKTNINLGLRGTVQDTVKVINAQYKLKDQYGSAEFVATHSDQLGAANNGPALDDTKWGKKVEDVVADIIVVFILTSPIWVTIGIISIVRDHKKDKAEEIAWEKEQRQKDEQNKRILAKQKAKEEAAAALTEKERQTRLGNIFRKQLQSVDPAVSQKFAPVVDPTKLNQVLGQSIKQAQKEFNQEYPVFDSHEAPESGSSNRGHYDDDGNWIDDALIASLVAAEVSRQQESYHQSHYVSHSSSHDDFGGGGSFGGGSFSSGGGAGI